MAKKKFWLGTMGPYYYDDSVQPKAVSDEGGDYLSNASISLTTETKTVVTDVDFDAGTVTTESITYVTNVVLETS